MGVRRAMTRLRKRGYNLEEGVDISECVAVFESTRDEVAVLLPVVTDAVASVVTDAVASVVSDMMDVAVSYETNNNW